MRVRVFFITGNARRNNVIIVHNIDLQSPAPPL